MFDEPSFQHLRKQMMKEYGSSEMDLVRLKLELVVCNYLKDKKVFWLQVRDGDLHRSVKQLHLDWDRRKAANKGLQNLSPSAAQCSDRLQASTALKSQTESLTWLREQPRTAGKRQSALQTSVQSPLEPQRSLHQLKHSVRQDDHSQQQSQLDNDVRQDQRNELQSQLKNNRRQDDCKQQHSNAAVPDPLTSLHQGTSGSTLLHNARPIDSQAATTAADQDPAQVASGSLAELPDSSSDKSCESSPPLSNVLALQALNEGMGEFSDQAVTAGQIAEDLKDNQQQVAASQSPTVDGIVLQKIEVLHSALKDIHRQQTQQKSDALGLQQLQAELAGLTGDVQFKESQVEHYSKMADMQRQRTRLDDRDAQFLSEVLEHLENARQGLAGLQQQQCVLLTQLEQANKQLKGFQINLVSQLISLEFE